MSGETSIGGESPHPSTPGETRTISLITASAEVVQRNEDDIITVNEERETESPREDPKWELSEAEPFTWESFTQRPCFYFPLAFLNISGWFGAIGLICVWSGVSDI